MDTNTATTGKDARRWERQPSNLKVSLVLKSEEFKVSKSAIAIDISVGGMQVRTSLKLIAGEWVGVIPNWEFPHAIPSHVVWVREDQVSMWIYAGLAFQQDLEH
jgi:hypothetical protein